MLMGKILQKEADNIWQCGSEENVECVAAEMMTLVLAESP